MNIITNFDLSFNQNITFSSLTEDIKNLTTNIHLELLQKAIKKIDDDFFASGYWKKTYNCNGFVNRTIITPFGLLTFKRRYYMNKISTKHDNFYYVDNKLQIPARKHLTNEALALILNVACDVNSSYASSHAIPGVVISKQTVSNYQKNMTTIIDDIPVVNAEALLKKQSFDVIYIEADEAHCNLQSVVSVDDSSDEIKTSKLNKKSANNKNIIDKLVLVHNGHNEPYLPLKKKSLSNKRYFGGIHMSSSSLADNICDYLTSSYNLNFVKRIFVSGDGARWIKSLSLYISNFIFPLYKNITVVPVLDKFHMNKYLMSIFGGNSHIVKYFKDHISDITADRFKCITDAYFAFCESRNISEPSFNDKVDYIINNLSLIKNQLDPLYNCPAAMEGHISHVFAKRLTSRPSGFSEIVLQNLTQMIIYKANGSIITSDIVKKWCEKYLTTYKPKKYVRLNKSFTRVYACNAGIPAMNSTNTNLKNFLRKQLSL